jgi:hypothetical protein
MSILMKSEIAIRTISFLENSYDGKAASVICVLEIHVSD